MPSVVYLANSFERPANNMPARVAFKLYRRGWTDPQIAKVLGSSDKQVNLWRRMYLNRRDDWRSRVEP